jgi:hypothetical protein
MPSFPKNFQQLAEERSNADTQATVGVKSATHFPDLRTETRPTVNTATAAYWLSRQEQTLRGWACHEDGPIRPRRIHGRLAWPVDEMRRILGVA